MLADAAVAGGQVYTSHSKLVPHVGMSSVFEVLLLLLLLLLAPHLHIPPEVGVFVDELAVGLEVHHLAAAAAAAAEGVAAGR
jgi:hypothetical protein